jgi:hypothetical protein
MDGAMLQLLCVNADLIFPKSAEVKFPSLAGMVINRSRDLRLLLEQGHTVYGTFRRTSSANFWRLEELDALLMNSPK